MNEALSERVRQLAARVRQTAQPRLCLVLGATDTGKTTLVAALAEYLARKGKVAVVDSDAGQSAIGPPATVGWALAQPGERSLSALRLRGIYFIGHTSPVGRLLPYMTATVNACRDAGRDSRTILLDTPGFIRDASALALWWQLCALLRPAMIVGVQREGELEPVLAGLEGSAPIVRLTCAPEARLRSAETRRQFRLRRYAEYFQDTGTHEYSLERVALQATHPPARLDGRDLTGCLVALRDGDSRDRVMGMICEWRREQRTLTVRSPRVDTSRIRCIVLGDLRLVSNGASGVTEVMA